MAKLRDELAAANLSAAGVADDLNLSIGRDYDEFPYEGQAFPLTHPERLATIATLFAMRPPPPEKSRVLELGCATGGNLIPMAFSMPRASFAGYDLSAVHVERAQATLRSLRLDNVTIAQRDILDLQPDSGEFDYIICHGVFSWVPDRVQDKILSLCHDLLSPHGVALVSYNTYPGWHMRESIRRMMCYHVRRFDDPKVQVAEARALLDFLANSVSGEKTAYAMYLASELKLLSGFADSYIAHEHLERHNTPLYFHQFVERASQFGLQYLGEAEFSSMLVKNFPGRVAQTLSAGLRDGLQMEQYMDFLRNRTFRSTLLCRGAQALDRAVDGARLADLYVAANVEPRGGERDLSSSQPVQFRSQAGIQLGVSLPLTKAALEQLSAAWPRAVHFPDLLDEAQHRLRSAGGTAGPQDGRLLAADLLQLYSVNAVELHSMASPFVTSVSETPSTSALARLQASQRANVTNLRHETIRVSEIERRVLRWLDGAHRREQIVEQLAAGVMAGELSLKRGAQPIDDAADRRAQLAAICDQLLAALARKALLIG